MRALYLATALFVALLTGCASAPQSQAPIYDARTANSVATTRPVTILSVRDVRIKRDASRAQQIGYAGFGTAIGAVIGNGVGKGNGNRLAQVVGGATGAAVGSAAVDAGELVPGLELTVRTLDRPETLVITQAAEYRFRAGQSALLTYGAGGQRVIP